MLGFGQRLLSEFTYTYNAFAYAKLRLAAAHNPKMTMDHGARENAFFGSRAPLDPSQPYSGYYDYRDDQLQLMKYTFKQIKQIAGGRAIVIALLPAVPAFKRYDPATTPRLSAELQRFARVNGMQLVDLLPDMYRDTKDWKEYFLSCDSHWSARGHAVAAALLKTKLASVYRERIGG